MVIVSRLWYPTQWCCGPRTAVFPALWFVSSNMQCFGRNAHPEQPRSDADDTRFPVLRTILMLPKVFANAVSLLVARILRLTGHWFADDTGMPLLRASYSGCEGEGDSLTMNTLTDLALWPVSCMFWGVALELSRVSTFLNITNQSPLVQLQLLSFLRRSWTSKRRTSGYLFVS